MRLDIDLTSAKSVACGPCAALLLSAIAPAQQLMRTIDGPSANGWFGLANIRVPDQNSDGYPDLLVGAPGFNGARGAIYCVSGGYLATGSGAQVLWSLAPAVNANDMFGWALAELGDVTGDGVADFVVGQPGYDRGTNVNVGAVRLISGASHSIVSLLWGQRTSMDAGANFYFGSTVEAIADSTGDGRKEVIVGAPGGPGYLTVLQSHLLLFDGTAYTQNSNYFYGSGSDNAGYAITSGFDIDGDGYEDFVYGRPGYGVGAANDDGNIVLATRKPTGLQVLGFYSTAVVGERFGTSVDAAHDYDGDGVVDIVVGAPNSPDGTGTPAGRAVVLSGAAVDAGVGPFEIYSLPFASPVLPGNNFLFGFEVCASDDLNDDGVGDVLVGAPDFFTSAGGPGAKCGLVYIYSGASGSKIAEVFGDNGDQLGERIPGAFADLDGDGYREFLAAGSLSDAAGINAGVVKCYRFFPVTPSTYCTGKLNSLGCTPAIAFSGTPGVTPPAPFVITASDFLNQKNGLLFYSHSATATAFQGAFKCAGDPVLRTQVLNSGGATSGSSCTGTYSFDFNARIWGGNDASLVAGAEVYAQWWSRDPASASHTSLSNALRFVINP